MKKNIISIIIILSISFLSSFSFSNIFPKWGCTDSYPDRIVVSNGFYQCRYSVTKETHIDSFLASKIYYRYDYIELKKITKSNIEFALMANLCNSNIIDISTIIIDYYNKNKDRLDKLFTKGESL